MLFRNLRLIGLLSVVLSFWWPLCQESDASPRAAPAVSSQTIDVADGAVLPVYTSRDWSAPLPDIERAVIVQHGRARNASDYFQTALTAQKAVGVAGAQTLMIAPQFIDQIDVDRFHEPANVLRYTPTGWEDGSLAIGPQPISSFVALDAILARLGDKHLFPNLKSVVVAGHSGGGQVVQRYAILGKGGAALARAGIAISYVVANPSSYAYFSPARPEPQIAAACPGYNDWKYGMEHLPVYVDGKSPAQLEADYVSRRVIYMLGSLDTNPDQPALDRSCMGEAQGPDRWARGHAYIAAMKARDHGTPNHTLYEIQGVGHNGDKMFTSACGLTALFGVASCK